MANDVNSLNFQRVVEAALADFHGVILEAHLQHFAALQQELGTIHEDAGERASAKQPGGNFGAAALWPLGSTASVPDAPFVVRRSWRSSLRRSSITQHPAFLSSSSLSERQSERPEPPGGKRRRARFPATSNAKLGSIVKTLTDQNHPKDEVLEMLNYCRNPDVLFQGFIGVVVIINAITIGISIDFHPQSPAWFFIDGVFALIFITELLMKMRYGCGEFFRGKDWRWNVFEFVLVAFAVFELVLAAVRQGGEGPTAMLSIFRIIRLARICRLARLARLQIFKDLFTMIVAASGGVKVLLWSFLLIALPIYVIALVLTETVGQDAEAGNGAECFVDLKTSFFTIFRCIVAGDCTTTDGKPIFFLITLYYGWQYSAIYCISVIVMNFGFFNVITAVFVDNIMTSAKFSDTQKKYERLLDADRFSHKAADLVEFVWNMHMNSPDATASTEALDIEHAMNLQITPTLFDRMMSSQGFKEILRSLDIAYEDQLDLFETLDVDGGGTIDMQELILGISKLRGDARRTDVIGISLIVRAMQSELALIRHHLEMPKSKLRKPRHLATNMGSGTALMGATPGAGMSTIETTGLETHTV